MTLARATGAGLKLSLGLKHPRASDHNLAGKSPHYCNYVTVKHSTSPWKHSGENMGVKCFADLGFWFYFCGVLLTLKYAS